MKIAKNNNFDGKLPAEMLENQQITPIFPENPPLGTAPLTNKIKIMQKYSFAAIFAKIYFCRNMPQFMDGRRIIERRFGR